MSVVVNKGTNKYTAAVLTCSSAFSYIKSCIKSYMAYGYSPSYHPCLNVVRQIIIDVQLSF